MKQYIIYDDSQPAIDAAPYIKKSKDTSRSKRKVAIVMIIILLAVNIIRLGV